MNHYERLGVARDAVEGEVTRAFRRMARTTHPDVGGDAAAFAELVEAYRVLRDPTERAAYDRALDDVPPAWEDVDWGVEVTPHGVVHRDGGVPPAGGRPGEGRDRPGGGDGRDGGDGPDGGPVVLDPFVGPPLRLPDPMDPRGLPPIPVIRPGPGEWAAAVLSVFLVAGAILLMALVLADIGPPAPPPPRPVDGSWLGMPRSASSDSGPEGYFAIWLLLLPVAFSLHISVHRTSKQVLAWLATMAAFCMPFGLFDAADASPKAGAAVFVAALAVAATVAWAQSVVLRRTHPDLLAALWRRDPRYRLDRHQRAEEWNAMREVMQLGFDVVLVGPARARPRPSGSRERRRTWDPRTGTETVRTLPAGVPPGWWLALDDDGRIVASAPPGAPDAWLSALSEARGAARGAAPRPSVRV